MANIRKEMKLRFGHDFFHVVGVARVHEIVCITSDYSDLGDSIIDATELSTGDTMCERSLDLSQGTEQSLTSTICVAESEQLPRMHASVRLCEIH